MGNENLTIMDGETKRDLKIPIIVWVDLKVSPMGLKSKLLCELNGLPVLRRTAERIEKVQKASEKIFFCPPDQLETVKSILSGLKATILPVTFDLPGWWPGVRTARKWAMESWRGGLLGACAFDEDFLPHVLDDLGKRFSADAIMTVNAHSPFVDPEILDRQIESYMEYQEDMKVNFTQAPPGLAGFIIDKNLIAQLPSTSKIAGSLLAYHPARPEMDLIAKLCNLKIESEIVKTGIRFICDTERTFSLAQEIFSSDRIEPSSISEITSRARECAANVLVRYPRELEIELVTGWPWEKGYRPTPSLQRGPLDVSLMIERISELTQRCDDLLVHIGGFGEPTKHPEFEAFIRRLKDVGVFGISMHTTGLIDQGTVERIASLPLDIVYVLVDAPDRQIYQNVMGCDGYETVIETIKQLSSVVSGLRKAVPLVVPGMIKTYATMEKMNVFFDGWFNQTGWAVIEGFSDYAGQINDLAVNSMSPPHRNPCRSIFSRMMILADGRVVPCNQDFNALCSVGSIQESSLESLWRDGMMKKLREAHLAARYEINSLCPNCRQWHRP